jgi:hypothetical protein
MLVPVRGADRAAAYARPRGDAVSLKQTTIPHGIIDILVTLGFFALFVLSRNWFLARYNPVLSLPK